MKRGKDGSVPGYNAQLVVQPDLKLGLFAAMSTGPDGREVPFFADVLVELGLEVDAVRVCVLRVVLLDVAQIERPRVRRRQASLM